MNVLPECNNDPRVVTNLLDGVNRTQDDMHIWLAPFENGCSHIITIDFEDTVTLSMIRIWVSWSINQGCEDLCRFEGRFLVTAVFHFSNRNERIRGHFKRFSNRS